MRLLPPGMGCVPAVWVWRDSKPELRAELRLSGGCHDLAARMQPLVLGGVAVQSLPWTLQTEGSRRGGAVSASCPGALQPSAGQGKGWRHQGCLKRRRKVLKGANPNRPWDQPDPLGPGLLISSCIAAPRPWLVLWPLGTGKLALL